MDFTLSPELATYVNELRSWSKQVGRLHARESDTNHALPKNANKLLATCPVPLSGDVLAGNEFPNFPDGAGIRGVVWHQSIAFGDIWLFEALARGLSHHVVRAIGTPEQIARWYDPIIEYGTCTAFGMSEPGAGSDTSRIATTATRNGDRWVINGTKMFCSLGAIAEYVLVFALTNRQVGRDSIRAFVVPRDWPGITVVKAAEDKLGFRSWLTTQLTFEDCAVPEDHMLGWSAGSGVEDAPNGLDAGLAGLNNNRPNVSAMGVGIAEAALDETRGEIRSRRLGFTPQRLRFIEDELERMQKTLDRCTVVNMWAQSVRDDLNVDNRREASLAKALGPPNADRVIRRCMQLLGPDGASENLLLEKWYRDIKILDIFEGTGQVLRTVVSRQLFGSRRGA
ncbi:acyl-CoA dehydrogenase family protein [Rhodococcus sp. MSC1_016]|uniref:acyl-CoA dehydrogenase family protein n=1 Tax=Rhodococcus sp. MSC1_016 TaxID=2909266 RepID=UPI0020307B12|nr:acyl-CoA dehydrogenase [Rhodococcus sp. MSC1_016]